jgi:hypothetical protein
MSGRTPSLLVRWRGMYDTGYNTLSNCEVTAKSPNTNTLFGHLLQRLQPEFVSFDLSRVNGPRKHQF